ncbi:MAG: hypothetical protein CSB13_01855 [Chloroflexi bacterium]|nr:MAG: hypothetical protein CSB13_01855 [Chloroflexota bacterium]
MWVVFRKKDKKVVGCTVDGGEELEKTFALQEVVSGLVDADDLNDYDAILVTDRAKAAEYLEAFPDKLTVKDTHAEPQLLIRDPETFSLHIKTDARDFHPVDGIPEIVADGQSFATITILKIDDRKKPQRGDKGEDRIYLRTNYGILRDEKGNKDINSIKLKDGEATFRLVSEKVKRVATVQMLSTNPKLPDSTYRIEFI